MKTIYVTKNKARTLERVKANHPLIHTSLSQDAPKKPPLIKLKSQHGESIAYVLSPAEFAALPESALAGAKVVRE